MSEDVKDSTQQQVDGAGNDADHSASDDDTGKDTSAEDQQTDETGAHSQDGASGADNEFMEGLLAEFDLESPEELKEFITGLADLKGKLAGEDVDDLLDNKELMLKYQKAWAEQEAQQLEAKETPEETIARLKKEKAEMQANAAKRRAKDTEAKEAQRLLSSFNSKVKKTIRGIKEVPSEYHKFLGLFMGVDNPINDVDLADTPKVVELTKKGAKQLLDFEQAVIKRYLAGKAKVPKVDTTPETTPEQEPKKVKNLGEARKVAIERIKGLLEKKK